VLEDRTMAGRAAAIGEAMRAEHGPSRAADEIERVIEATKARRA
jgi:UDP:flavonoid glycosyltransferase YjiC (YdhE family)